MPDSWGILTGIRPTKIVHRMIDQGLDNQRLQMSLGKIIYLKKDKAQLLIG
jgi:oxygen-independent coproporphyrinogen-3 oxidase